MRRIWTDEELAELKDPDMWDDENIEIVTPTGKAGIVAAVRFSAEESERLAECAQRRGISIIELIREMVLSSVDTR
jgi:hypothetical protein